MMPSVAQGVSLTPAMRVRWETDERYRWQLSGIARSEWPEQFRQVAKPQKKITGKTTPRKPKRVPIDCVHLGARQLPPADPNGNPCGCPAKEVWRCSTHGICTLGTAYPGVACCHRCPDYVPDGQRDWTRHLIYFVYPVAGNGVWQRNLDQLLSRIDLFNGRRIIAISTHSPLHQLDPPEAVEERLAGRAEILRVPAQGSLGEVTAFVPLWQRLRDCDGLHDATFYAHAKGVTKSTDPGISVHRWTELMYRANLDHWDDVAAMLEQYPVVGAFKKIGSCFKRRASWHYHGTFYWCRNADVFSRKWNKVRARYGGTELWPATVFKEHEAGSIFYAGSGYSMYSLEETARAESCYAAWPFRDRDGHTERERYRKIVDNALAAADPPPRATSGDGIVMLAGGRFDVDSYVALQMVRDTGCQLPVKLYHHSSQPVSDLVRGIAGVEVIPFDDLHPPFKTAKGWEWKEIAITDSGFRRVMYLDADAYPVVDPTPRLADVDESGIVFWWDLDISEHAFHLDVFGVPEADRGYMRTPQAGVMFIDTVRHARALQAWRRLNEHSHYFYSVTFSDQELLRCIWTRLRLPYTAYTDAPVNNLGRGDRYIHNHVGPDGETFVVHRTSYKFGQRPERVATVPGEARAWEHFERYQQLQCTSVVADLVSPVATC